LPPANRADDAAPFMLFFAVLLHGVVCARRNARIRGFGSPVTTPPRMFHHLRDGTKARRSAGRIWREADGDGGGQIAGDDDQQHKAAFDMTPTATPAETRAQISRNVPAPASRRMISPRLSPATWIRGACGWSPARAARSGACRRGRAPRRSSVR
jgi:hypothetical protein